MEESSSAHEDPLIHDEDSYSKQVGRIAIIAVGALLAQALAMGAISLASQVTQSDDDELLYERVAMEIIEPEPETRTEPEPETRTEPEPETRTEPEPETHPIPQVKTKPKPAKRKVRAAQPTDEPQSEPAKPARRIIGLSLESTVSGGNGPSFSTGNTRLGQTSRVANDPNRINRHRGASATVGHRAPTPGPNRVAAHIPSAKIKLVRPKRITRVTPKYPAVLRAQNIEGTVVLRVHIDKSGNVIEVDIVAGSSHNEFNKAASIAALKERFKPATKNGVAIAYAITFSSRFRLDEA